VAGLLGRHMQPLQRLPGSSSSSISSAVQQADLRRLQQRAEHAVVDAFDVLVNGDLQQWESMVCANMAAGMSLGLALGKLGWCKNTGLGDEGLFIWPALPTYQRTCTLRLRVTCPKDQSPST
jgi:hypothetical protein